MSVAWNDYCAEVDTRIDADVWADRMAYEALSDEERAANEEAVRLAVLAAKAARDAELKAMGPAPF